MLLLASAQETSNFIKECRGAMNRTRASTKKLPTFARENVEDVAMQRIERGPEQATVGECALPQSGTCTHRVRGNFQLYQGTSRHDESNAGEQESPRQRQANAGGRECRDAMNRTQASEVYLLCRNTMNRMLASEFSMASSRAGRAARNRTRASAAVDTRRHDFIR